METSDSIPPTSTINHSKIGGNNYFFVHFVHSYMVKHGAILVHFVQYAIRQDIIAYIMRKNYSKSSAKPRIKKVPERKTISFRLQSLSPSFMQPFDSSRSIFKLTKSKIFIGCAIASNQISTLVAATIKRLF